MLEFTYLEDSRARYNEMLKEAENVRRAMHVQRRTQRLEGNSLLLNVGNWLIESGSWLKQHAQMGTSVS